MLGKTFKAPYSHALHVILPQHNPKHRVGHSILHMLGWTIGHFLDTFDDALHTTQNTPVCQLFICCALLFGGCRWALCLSTLTRMQCLESFHQRVPCGPQSSACLHSQASPQQVSKACSAE